MTTPIQDLIDQRVTLITEARDYLAECEKERGVLSEDESARFDAMHDDADQLKTQIDALEATAKASADRAVRQLAAEDQLKELQAKGDLDKIRENSIQQQGGRQQPINRLEAQTNVLQQWGLNGTAGCQGDPEFMAMLTAAGCKLNRGGLEIPLAATAPKNLYDLQNAQSIGTDTAGGHTTFPGFSGFLETALLQFGAMRQAGTVVRTATGSALDYPTMNDSTNAGELLGENVGDAENDVVFGNLVLNAYKYTSKIVLVSKELMQDSAFSMAQVIGSALGERLGRIENTHATTGTGSSQPNGIATASTLGVTAASATVLTADELIDLESSVDTAYRTGAGWMFNDTTRAEIRKLKTSDLQYIWQPGLQDGQPDRLLGYPVFINPDVGDTATGVISVLFGQLSKYLLRDVMGVTLVQLNERYADTHAVGFVAIARFDGDLLDAGTNPVKHILMA